MGGVRLDTTYTDTVPSGTAGAQRRRVVGTQDEGISLREGQVFGDCSCLVHIVSVG